MDTVALAGRTVARLGISVAALPVTGIWGEPASREAAVAAIRRAVELGAGVLEVPVPFGAGADLVRQAQLGGAFIAARLTDRLPDLAALRHRLGRLPDLVLAEPGILDDIGHWPVPLGMIVGHRNERATLDGIAAVRGPWPAPDGMIERCEEAAIPYLAPSTAVLAAGERTIALPSPRRRTDVERLFGAGPTPPGAGPE
jgi:hypothetical protein